MALRNDAYPVFIAPDGVVSVVPFKIPGGALIGSFGDWHSSPATKKWRVIGLGSNEQGRGPPRVPVGCRRAKAGSVSPTGVPSASFLQASSNHDICYQTCNASVNEATCDDQVLQQSIAACDTLKSSPTFTHKNGKMQKLYKSCVNAAQKMHTGLQLGGSPAFQMRRAQYCQCC